MMLGFGLGDVAKAGVLRTLTRAVAARAGRGQPEGIADPAITAANPAIFRGQGRRSSSERGAIVEPSLSLAQLVGES